MKIKIKNSVVVLPSDEAISKAVREFNLADATPMDCMDFIAKLKNGNIETPGIQRRP